MATEVETNVCEALNVLHGIGVVHLDVVPNNILWADRTWKLADLDSCTPIGEQSGRQPLNERYVHSDRLDRITPANPESDWYGLAQVAKYVRQ